MRTINCIVCGSDRKSTLAEQSFKDDYLDMADPSYASVPRRMALCESCGFVYHDPQLDEKDQEVLYSKFRDATYRGETPDQYFDRITGLPPEQSENTQKVRWLRERMGARLDAPGSLLDVGCGGGVFIHTFRALCPKWDACGVEPTTAFAQLAARRLGQPVIAGAYKPGLFPGRKFDLVTVNQVLEHLFDPIGFLKSLRLELAEGGAVYLEVPHIADIGHLPPTHDRFLMQHLWFFSTASLTNVCRLAGYEPVAIEKQHTLRDRNNAVMLMRPVSTGKGKPELLKEDPAAIRAMSRLTAA